MMHWSGKDYAEGYDMKSNQLTGLQEALQAAEASDVIVVAVGERFGQSGEKASKVNEALNVIIKY